MEAMRNHEGTSKLALTRGTRVDFAEAGILFRLEALDVAGLDELAFGVVRMDRAGVVVLYNACESAAAGLSPGKVLGRHFFEAVAPCMNNFMVAARFEDEPELDATIDYVLTFRMRPTPVHLRLLQAAATPHLYVLIDRTQRLVASSEGCIR